VEALAKAVPLDHEFNDDNRSKELKRGRRPDQIPDIGNHEIYWNLGLSYMRMSQYQQALDAYLAMRHLAPTNPDAYLSIASVYLSTGHPEEAGISLLQALLLDSNRAEALRLLVDIYHQIDHEGCSIVMTRASRASIPTARSSIIIFVPPTTASSRCFLKPSSSTWRNKPGKLRFRTTTAQ